MTAALPDRRTWAAIVLAAAGAALSIACAQVLALAAADVNAALGVSADTGSWLPTVYTMAQVALIPFVAWLALAFGLHRLAVAAGLLYAAASAASLAADTLPVMLVLRALQGAAGGAFSVILMMLVMRSFPPGPARPLGLIIFAAAVSLPNGFAASLGAALIARVGIDAVFAFQALWALGYCAIGPALAAPTPVDLTLLRRLNIAGGVLLGIGLAALILVLDQGNRRFWFDSRLIGTASLIAAVSLAAGVLTLAYRRRPLLDLSLLGRPSFAGALLLGVWLRFGLLVSGFVVPQYLGQLQGFRIEQLGPTLLWLLPAYAVALPVAYAGAVLNARATLVAGLLLFAGGAWLNVSLTADWAIAQFQFSLLVVGAGQILFLAALLRYATDGVRPEQGPTAAGLFNVMRVVGQSCGAALMATLVTEREKYHSHRLTEHLSQGDTNMLEQLSYLTGLLLNRQADTAAVGRQALALLDQRVREQAFVLAYSDAFMTVTVLLIGGALLAVILPSLSRTPASAPPP